MEQKQKNEEPLTVGRFWSKYPNLIIIKSFIILTVEVALMGLSLYAIISESSIIYCEPPDSEEHTQLKSSRAVNQLKVSQYMMCFSNVYNISCLLNTILIKWECVSKKKTIISYCLLDCYCCVATFCYLYGQICDINFKNYCKDELPLTKQILWIEFIWIYIMLLIGIFSQVFGVCAILYRQRQKAKAQLLELQKRQAEELEEKKKSEIMQQQKEAILKMMSSAYANKLVTNRRRQNQDTKLVRAFSAASPSPMSLVEIAQEMGKGKKKKKKKKVLKQLKDDKTLDKKIALRSRVRTPPQNKNDTQFQNDTDRNYLVQDEPSAMPRAPRTFQAKLNLSGLSINDQQDSQSSENSFSDNLV